MLSIKLVRTGKKNLPAFRVVVGSGNKIVETLGNYYPYSNPPLFHPLKERIDYWRKSGARLTPAVADLLKGKYEFKRYVPKTGAKTEEAAPAVSPVTEATEKKESTETPPAEAVETPPPATAEKPPENA